MTISSDIDRGLIGARHLTVVQTFHISRLTSHPVPLVPESFITVTGRGPKDDSNGSGKTSFLSACSVLLADPQWRLATGSAEALTEMLFNPSAAGLPEGQKRARPDHGYIAGVFAAIDEPDSPDEAITVWIRINTSSPYFEARYTPGVRLADAETEADRHQQAEDIWAALKAPDKIGARKYADLMYGPTPRCMAYLDTTMRPATASLLSQQVTDLSPEQIADALLDLLGRSDLLEQEAAERGRLADLTETLAARDAENETWTRDEDDQLHEVNLRDKAREHLAEGDRIWTLHDARGLLDALAAKTDSQTQIDDLSAHVDDLTAKVAAADAAHAAAGNPAALRKDALDKKAAAETARAEYQRNQNASAQISGTIDEITRQRTGKVDAAKRHDGRPLHDVRAAHTAAVDAHDDARVAAATARAAVTAAERDLAAAEAGTGGNPDAVAALTAAGITATPLMDDLDIPAKHRDRWEPLLWPYRTALVITEPELPAATAALAGQPGTILVTEDRKPGKQPDRITSTRSVTAFLTALTDRADGNRTDSDAHVTVVGGFPDPVTGRTNLIARAKDTLRQARETLTAATQAAGAAQARLDLAAAAVDAAQAAADVAALDERLTELRERQTVLDAAEPSLREARDAADADYVAAEGLYRTAQQRIDALAATASNLRAEKAEAAKRLTAVKQQHDQQTNAITVWAAAWNGTPETAQAALEADANLGNLSNTRLRNRASEELFQALIAVNAATPDTAPPALRSVLENRDRLNAGETGISREAVSYAEVSRPFKDWLDEQHDTDQALADRIDRARHERHLRLDAARDQVTEQEQALNYLRDGIEQNLTTMLERVSDSLDRLDRERGGFGARLDIDASNRPVTPNSPWRWRVTPKWRRSSRGGLIDYKQVANGAQVKVFAIQLVVSALLAANDPTGRVLILDELGNSLGDTNRRDVLEGLNRVAKQRGVTILGAAQDSVLTDAAGHCGEILWFCHPREDATHNEPTRAWGHDENGLRVALTTPLMHATHTPL
jgi:hypothetical protein